MLIVPLAELVIRKRPEPVNSIIFASDFVFPNNLVGTISTETVFGVWEPPHSLLEKSSKALVLSPFTVVEERTKLLLMRYETAIFDSSTMLKLDCTMLPKNLFACTKVSLLLLFRSSLD